MPKHMPEPVLVFDFDNTLTEGDVLDDIVEKFSPNEDWREWEREWVAGRLPAIDCLRLQVENLRVAHADLLEDLRRIRVDPAFAKIVHWARAREVEVMIVSDSFQPLILHILENNAITGVPVFANGLEFSGERLHPSFPFHDPKFPRSANSKARHFARHRDRSVIFTGDGLSDVDAALASDIVFAKDSLARYLASHSVPFQPFDTLEPVLEYLRSLGIEKAESTEF